jgi:hypothetical protein
LFERLPNITISGVDALLPWSNELPIHIKMPGFKKKEMPDG